MRFGPMFYKIILLNEDERCKSRSTLSST
jgi:hypothetical protein